METREKNQTRLSRWWGRCPARHGLLILSLLWLGAYFATRQNRPWMEWLCHALVRPWHRTAGRFYSLVRFSAAEWIIALWIIMGIAFLVLMDALLPHLAPDSFHLRQGEQTKRRALLLVLAVTLHNIPEGMAIGVSFATASHSGQSGQLAAAMALALGIGIQNFPEGAAISLPLRQEGMSRRKAFAFGAASGFVEPVFALLTD